MTTSFPVTQDTIIKAAMRQCGALDQSSTPNPIDYQNCGEALNLLLKTWVASGIPLWKVSTVTLPFVANQTTYYMGPTGASLVMDRPLRVLEAEIQNTIDLTSIELWPLAREQYVELSGKFIALGVPTQYWFEPLGSEATSPNARISFYPIPADTTFQALLKCLTPINNAILLSDVIDFPAEYYAPLKWCLAYEIANEYPVSDSRYARIQQRAKEGQELIVEWGQEQDVEVRIKYDRRGR